MQNKRLLIVEPNSEFASELQAVAQGVGYSVDILYDPDSVLSKWNTEKYSTVIIECMLPGQGGVELAKELKARSNDGAVQFILMSGIFTERSFIKESLEETGAVEFFKKPFHASEILNHLNLEVVNAPLSAEKNIYLSFGKTKLSARDKRRLIESLEKIHSYDLPFVLSLLCETKATGHLNIIDTENRISGVSFSQGNIVQVDIADKSSFLGQILVNKGLVLPDDLESVLADEKTKQKRIATRLIEANVLSPHGFDEALKEQMNIRLSKLIFDIEVSINFVQGEVPSDGPQIDSHGFLNNLYIWVMSKISLEWLINHYLTWSENPLKFGPFYNPQHPIFTMPIFEGQGEEVPGSLLNLIKTGKTISQIAEDPNIGMDQAYKLVHLLVCKGIVLFGDKSIIEGLPDRILRLQRILQQVNQRESLLAIFELIGGKKGMPLNEVKQVQMDFLASLGPAPLVQDNADLRKAYLGITSKVQEAIQLMEAPEKIENYEKNIVSKTATLQLKLQSDFDEARNLLAQRKFQAALGLLMQVSQSKIKFEFLPLYLLWAKLGMYPESTIKERLLRDIEVGLSQITPEEKHTPLANFLFGLVYKIKGDMANSRKSFERALTMDPNMAEAKRELNLMAISIKAKKENRSMLGKIFGGR